MNNQKPLLKVYADANATRRMIRGIKQRAKITGFFSAVFAVTLFYLIYNQIDNSRILSGYLFLLLAFLSWASFKSIPSYEKELKERPLLYSFYIEGFISHRSEQKLLWEQIGKIYYSKRSINLDMRKTPKIAKMSFMCISESDVESILKHFKAHAPERLAKKIRM